MVDRWRVLDPRWKDRVVSSNEELSGPCRDERDKKVVESDRLAFLLGAREYD